ncbi:DUF2799 domain-containing protein [Pseudoalteromonas fenneropenaei]|uniref:DUF2799 domain-containing protein n=1 Tax=Pseudoalteromonas fenneropenaei TaxID=1737459 RepID=A0ABV7CLA9_9GAMM
MKKFAILTLALATSALLSGCNVTDELTTKTPQVACQNSENWQDAGFQMASEGRSITGYQQLVEQCGFSFDETAESQFVSGYLAGLVEFCSYDNGEALGAKNVRDPNVCPHAMRAEFAKGYEAGLLSFNTRQNNMKTGQRFSQLQANAHFRARPVSASVNSKPARSGN